MELPLNVIVILIVLLILVLVVLILVSRGGNNFTDFGGEKIDTGGMSLNVRFCVGSVVVG